MASSTYAARHSLFGALGVLALFQGACAVEVAGPKNRLVFTQLGSAGTSGTVLSGSDAPKVQLQDAYGRAVSLAGLEVELTAWRSSDCSTLPATGNFASTATQTSADGSVSFSNVRFSRSGRIYLKATSVPAGLVDSGCSATLAPMGVTLAPNPAFLNILADSATLGSCNSTTACDPTNVGGVNWYVVNNGFYSYGGGATTSITNVGSVTPLSGSRFFQMFYPSGQGSSGTYFIALTAATAGSEAPWNNPTATHAGVGFDVYFPTGTGAEYRDSFSLVVNEPGSGGDLCRFPIPALSHYNGRPFETDTWTRVFVPFAELFGTACTGTFSLLFSNAADVATVNHTVYLDRVSFERDTF